MAYILGHFDFSYIGEEKQKHFATVCVGGCARARVRVGRACGAHAHVIYVKVRGQIGIVGAPLLLCGAQTSNTYIFFPPC